MTLSKKIHNSSPNPLSDHPEKKKDFQTDSDREAEGKSLEIYKHCCRHRLSPVFSLSLRSIHLVAGLRIDPQGLERV